MQDLEKAFELIEQHFSEEDIDFCLPKTQKIIDSAEKILNINFSDTYKKFLKKYGAGGIGFFEIYGIVKNEEFYIENLPHITVPDAVWTTIKLHEKFEHPLFLLIIYNVGEGTKYCLDTSQMNASGECPVVAWPLGGYEETPVLEIVAEDFGEFFLDRVAKQIALKTEQTR
ncbi:MAG: SMI1/KNR4 family protein [Alphaproteobacteria bacterium]